MQIIPVKLQIGDTQVLGFLPGTTEIELRGKEEQKTHREKFRDLDERMRLELEALLLKKIRTDPGLKKHIQSWLETARRHHQKLLEAARETFRSNQNPKFITSPGDTEFDSSEDSRARSILKESQGIINMIDKALLRLKTGKYGLCDFCEEPIGLYRLLALPWAKCCLACAKKRQ